MATSTLILAPLVSFVFPLCLSDKHFYQQTICTTMNGDFLFITYLFSFNFYCYYSSTTTVQLPPLCHLTSFLEAAVDRVSSSTSVLFAAFFFFFSFHYESFIRFLFCSRPNLALIKIH